MEKETFKSDQTSKPLDLRQNNTQTSLSPLYLRSNLLLDYNPVYNLTDYKD